MKSKKLFIIISFLLTFAFQVSAQNLYPNELEGYKLIENKRIKNLKVGISTKADVIKIFNSDCENLCDYDKDWLIKFKYFDKYSEFPTKDSTQIKVKHNPEYLGKLFAIVFMSKVTIPFEKIKLPEIFIDNGGIAVSANNESGSIDLSSQKYRDSYGLEYELQYETTLTSSGKETLKKITVELESIRYGASDNLVKKMFIVTK